MHRIGKLLVANRGEIAIRVFRAAAEQNIRTVAIYTFEDRYSLHRYKADEAYQIGRDDDPLKPYLNIEEIIRIAKRSGCDAIHPGYGFLSENVNFSARCREENIIFVGPSPEVMEKLGDKVNAKEIARKIGLPLIPDNEAALDSVETAKREAGRIGYPVILKASAGGGGRGMRVVNSDEEMGKYFPEARSEAFTAFGNDTVFMEKLINRPKHIEVQILGDQHGNIVHLFERDCSVQRRFQKVVEMAPAPSLKEETRQNLFAHAVKLCAYVGYSNAGTVEFLVDEQENIYFIEVNPRIQVEHTVTEEITGVDIVRCQLFIASGYRLDSPEVHVGRQEDVTYSGFAIQCRITTEDPENEFKPDFGTIIAYRNAGGHGIRIDEGSSYSGVRISPFFDSMLAKVTTKGRTLDHAIQKMSRTLAEFRIRGVKTNIPFLENVLQHPEFMRGKASVRFIEDHPELFVLSRKLDRGTKILKYLAEVSVNGNPDVKVLHNKRVFNTPRVPEYDDSVPFPAGTKQRLDQLGREKFITWLKEDKQVHYTDTTFRDAHQSLLATRVRTYDMLKVAESFARNHPEVFSMEVWGGATFDVALRFLHECPWERLRLLRAAIPNILLQMLLRGANAIGYTAYADNLVEKFIEKSWENGIDIFRIFDSLNWTDNMKVSIDAVRNRTNALAEVCIGYTGDILDPSRKKYDLRYYTDLARKIEDAGAHILCIKDMAGLLKPYSAELLVSELKKCIDIPVHLHTHDTSSIQSATYLKAIEAGVDVIDVALGSLSGLTSQPNFESVAEALRNTPFERKCNIASLHRFSDYWEDVREIYYPFESDLKAGTAQVYEHEIPGGQYSNLKPQALSLGLGEKMPEIKKAYKEVNELFGDIVKVTPSSKVVGDLALYMVANNLSGQDILTKGDAISFPESVRSFFRGDLGQPYGGFPQELQKIVLKEEKPYSELPNAHIPPVDFEEEFKAFHKKFDDRLTLLDFLSYKFYPKVFEEYYRFRCEFGDVSILPSPEFFYGLKVHQEVLVEIAEGKTIMVKLLSVSDADDCGMRSVSLKLNGQTRTIEVRDKSVKVTKVGNRKVTDRNHVGTPLQGRLSKIFVKEGQTVKKNAFLFTVEAMKMESTITATEDMVIRKVHLQEGTIVESNDLVIESEDS